MGSFQIILLKFIKFVTVGFTGLAIDFGITYLFKEKLKANPFIANSLGFIVAASTNYGLNRIWTFQSENQDVGSEYTSFIVIALVGLAINNALLYYMFKKRAWNFYFSKLVAIMITTIWNFIANLLITFA